MKKNLLLLIFSTILQFVSAQETEKAVKNRQNIQEKLLEAKALLKKDDEKLWGKPIWNDSIIVIDFDNSIYSLIKLSNSKTDNGILYYKIMEPNSLVFVNTTQKCEGKEYATVLSNYLDDKSATIIHELFHLLQMKSRKFNGNPIEYLDQTNARILLRLEYRALKNALNAINKKREIKEVKSYLNDAVIFRKQRQNQYSKYINDELEIETLEGLANYTGFALSSYDNIYEKVIEEINDREEAKTYTRPFPYATGPAYGLIFDYLNISWRNSLDKIYNFTDIYEVMILKSKITITKKDLKVAKFRNNFNEINKQEIAREEEQKKLVSYYTDLLINKPTLKVALTDIDHYGRTFNMNGTLSLNDKGIVYSSIKGRDKSGNNFGSFATVEGKNQLGKAGILSYDKDGKTYFVFPLPIKIEGKKIINEFYEIELNPDWKVIKQTDGNMEIVRKSKN